MKDDWLWTYDGFDPLQEGHREALCTVGNGYFATRGALPEAVADPIHYPGTYVAGVFNRLRAEISGRTVENESMVNVPNWLPLTLATADGMPFDVAGCDVLDHRVELDMARSVLSRWSRLRQPDGRVLVISQRRFVSLRDFHVAALETTVVAENWSGPLQVCSALDGTVRNSGIARYDELGNDHLDHHATSSPAADSICLEVDTNNSHIRIAETARCRVFRRGELEEVERRFERRQRWAGHHFTVELDQGEELVIEKVITLFTSRDSGIYEPHSESENVAAHFAPRFDELLERHVMSWRDVWSSSRIEIRSSAPNTSAILNLHILHLHQTVSKNSAELDVGVPARGLHGEAYRGHIFWDELFIFPFLNWRAPELTRALLHYRARRIGAAREGAARHGYAGAMYPWQSASSGREETQTTHLNPTSGRWLPDASQKQRHINVAIVYNVWAYWQATGDLEFLRTWGAEMVLEITRFWASAAAYNPGRDRYEIKGVMGPDEYHEASPDRAEPGLDNNAYTNLMVVWCIERAFDMLKALPRRRADEMKAKLGIDTRQLERWNDISHKMYVPFHDGNIVSQFEGYGQLAELDWAAYREKYDNIQRLDRILESEGDSPNRYKLSKQPDVLMLFYLLSVDDLRELIERLGYPWDGDLVRRNIDYYRQRTSDGSTLSQMIHAWVLSRIDPQGSWERLLGALQSDVADTQGGTTAEGIHLGAMAGTVDLVQRCYTGLETRRDQLCINPSLPRDVDSIAFGIRFRSQSIDLHFTHDKTTATVGSDSGATIPIEICGQLRVIHPGQTFELAHPREEPQPP
jgi:trehalose/maltose hydrolase-like predicted phosphorylase